MSTRFLKFVMILLSLFVLSACGGSNTSNSVPPPTDPNSDGGGTIGGGGGGADPLGLIHSFPVTLTDSANFSALEQVFLRIVAPPVVGDPRIRMMLTGIGSSISGTLRLAYEDFNGGKRRDWQSFESSGLLSSTQLEMIFQDDQMVVRIQGNRTSANLVSGGVSYHVRVSGETECRTYTCTGIDPAVFNPAYPMCYEAWRVQTCRDFVGTPGRMISYGSFQDANLSEWVN